MRMHVQTVVWQESADAVRDGSRNLVDGLQLLKTVPCGGQPELGRFLHQAKLGVDVGLFLLVGQSMPCFPL